jgi:hypothetical protein
LKDTHNRIKNMELEPVTFEGVWKWKVKRIW